MDSAPQKLTTNHYPLKTKRGFSLIELLVVIAIIGILSSGAIAAYNNFNQGQVVRRAALKLKSDLRESQNRATSGVKTTPTCKDDQVNNETGVAPPDFLDDHVLLGHFVKFDLGITTGYARGERCQWDTTVTTPFTVSTETVSFPPSVTLESINVVGGSLTGNVLTVNFKSLKGVEFYDGDDTLIINPDGSGSIAGVTSAVIRITDGVNSYDLTIDRSGLIFERRVP